MARKVELSVFASNFIYLSITWGVLVQSPELMIKYLTIIQMELEFGNVGF